MIWVSDRALIMSSFIHVGLHYHPLQDALVVALHDSAFQVVQNVSSSPFLTYDLQSFLAASGTREVDTALGSMTSGSFLVTLDISKKVRETFVAVESGGTNGGQKGKKEVMKTMGFAAYGRLGTVMWLHE